MQHWYKIRYLCSATLVKNTVPVLAQGPKDFYPDAPKLRAAEKGTESINKFFFKRTVNHKTFFFLFHAADGRYSTYPKLFLDFVDAEVRVHLEHLEGVEVAVSVAGLQQPVNLLLGGHRGVRRLSLPQKNIHIKIIRILYSNLVSNFCPAGGDRPQATATTHQKVLTVIQS